MKGKIDWSKLLISVVSAIAIGSSGAFFTAGAVSTWYRDINKPFFTPPSWLFGPAWTILFILMGVAFYLFIFNVAWSGIFFGMGAFWLAYAEILILWWLIYRTIKSFSVVDMLAGRLLLPYLAWVTFASFLNLGVAWLN
ncbi:MAG: Tryptophan-rich sensory protein [Candidatus Collierbacteria bacterium GW2011_GWA1_44_12]|uniref:Tryptophan-rich sensory protein n=1 Tax=Candidatus Collierbacteria bacterium GW2011_GWA1_44_12 TaxID=1618376 RepID=A0A0G1JG84_9BACT|nr:MAG: Tryptophan-rich sensory protein [Candidatus Collierbacteria bacterium GW2011_GWA1_44_12]